MEKNGKIIFFVLPLVSKNFGLPNLKKGISTREFVLGVGYDSNS